MGRSRISYVGWGGGESLTLYFAYFSKTPIIIENKSFGGITRSIWCSSKDTMFTKTIFSLSPYVQVFGN